jgi:N-acetylglucosaminyldiphosphoundecaprenol N-acetyl-beta-D-mannosaminyltransferase
MAKRLDILNIWVDAISRREAGKRVREILDNGRRPHLVFASNPEKNYSVPADPLLYDIYRRADILLPDGIGMVMAARLLYGIQLERVPGSEFIFDICEIARTKGCGVYFYGAKEWVSQSACRKLEACYPGLKIVGRSNGYVPSEEMPQLIDAINASGAQVLFVALGSPRQEQWMAAHGDQLTSVKICQGIGGTLDTIVGNVKRAPQLWCRWHLEWFYRLLKEPKRIRRQKVLPLFALAVLQARISRRKPLAA